MKRREFITLLGGSVAWPLAARAQQSEQFRRIGVLMGYAESDSDARAWYAAFREVLQKLGWTEGRNIQIDTRWAIPDDAESMRRLAKELVTSNRTCRFPASGSRARLHRLHPRHVVPKPAQA
jgi:putative tryptophan/tyrosine transport system substrate-binding protein